VGGNEERTNIEVVRSICAIMDELRPHGAPHAKLITYVPDRPGHDRRYAIDSSRILRTVGWRARHAFSSSLREVASWYLEHSDWVDSVRTGAYRQWMDKNYGSRLA
jgi:dTDP-glucose 4,6-dehydratase